MNNVYVEYASLAAPFVLNGMFFFMWLRELADARYMRRYIIGDE